MRKTVGKYDIGRTLGEGTFGKVKFAVNTETGEEVAIKVLDKERIQKQSMGSQIKKEISIMKQLEHPNVVRLNEVLASRTKIFIVLELVTGGELFDLIVKSGRLSELEAWLYFRQLVNGVSYCHSAGVAHRDLKPENLLLDQHMTLKISDFGLSALYDGNDGSSRSELLHTTCGTPNYVAPEVLQNQGYDGRMADCWSIGVILYVLLAGFLPFDENTMSALFTKIKDADYAYPEWFSKLVVNLIDGILVADPRQRVSLADVKQHGWFLQPSHGREKSSTCDGEDNAEEQPFGGTPAPASQHTTCHASTSRGDQEFYKPGSIRVVDLISDLPPSATLSVVKTHLHAANCTVTSDNDTSDVDAHGKATCVRQWKEPNPAVSSLEATLITSNGMLTVTVSVRPHKTGGSHVHVLRGKGDILAYTNFQASLIDALKPSLV
mmetsp:Transcript_28643/g.92219  ORF Transcript_28643/g.92219 Transcript_28643/m.92219 type:complete len:436 (-) Transcript_28643:226-1533(-)